MRDEIKARLIESIEVLLDPYLADHGFGRRPRSLTYKRAYRGATQMIDIEVQIHPKDNSNAAAAVYPIMEVHVPLADQVLDAMIDGNVGLMVGVTKGLSNQPIDFTSQKAELGRWFIYQPDSVPVVVERVRAFIKKWTMPFLDVYATPEDIVSAHERGDGRMVADYAHLMRVVAAALASNRTDYAQALMDKRFGAIGLRGRYQQVFDYVEKHS
jgi:hypothetical protein